MGLLSTRLEYVDHPLAKTCKAADKAKHTAPTSFASRRPDETVITSFAARIDAGSRRSRWSFGHGSKASETASE